MDGGGRAQARRAVGALAGEIAHDHVAGAEEPAPEARREADRAGAHDEHGLAGPKAGPVHRVKAHGEGLDHGAFAKRNAFR